MRWLVTAFEPFAGADSNSSLLTLGRIKNSLEDEAFVFLDKPVPVTFSGAWPFIEEQLQNDKQLKGLLCLGQAENRSKISLERLALNLIDARIPDNEGVSPGLQKIDPRQPDILWSSIPWELAPTSSDWERSYSAGTYVCNLLMFRALTWANTHQKRAGFVHLPLLQSQGGEFSDQVAQESLLQIFQFLKSL